MSISEVKLNNVTVKPLIPILHEDETKVKGGKLISVPYSISFLCSKRKSGKTTVISKLALETTSKRTVFWIFSPTAKADDTMMELIKRLKARGNVVNLFPSLMDGKTDILQTIVNSLLEGDESESEEVKQPKKIEASQVGGGRPITIYRGAGVAPIEPPKETGEISKYKEAKYKPKKKAPSYCFIIDDLATELNKTRGGLASLCFNGRHLKASVYISFQYKNQLPPALWSQATYIFIFKNFSKEKLEEIYKSVDLHSVTLPQFLQIYDYATKDDDRPFLLCDVSEGIYRKNFNKKIEFHDNVIE